MACVCALALTLSACGGSASSATGLTESASVTETAYAKRAAAICERHGAEILAAAKTRLQRNSFSSESGTYEELARSVFALNIETELEELQALPIPLGRSAEVEEMLETLQEGIGVARARQITSIEDFAQSFKAFDKVVNRAGVGGCSFGP